MDWSNFPFNFNTKNPLIHTPFVSGDLGGGSIMSIALPVVRVGKTINQTIPSGVYTALSFDETVFDTGNFHSEVTNNSRLTCTVAGAHAFGFTVHWDDDVTGHRVVAIYRNGSKVRDIEENGELAFIKQSGIWLNEADAGDYFELFVFQNSGTDRDLSFNTAFYAIRLKD